jgi:tyrosine-protein phosphatase YwqE
MASLTRQDLLKIVADTAIETAIASVIAGDATKLTGRKEALRYLVRSATKKDVTNKTRVRSAAENNAAQYTSGSEQ